SAVEARWATIEQEAYAVYFCILKLSHFLLGHHFIVETDHRNLLYLEKATSPKLVRWRLRLQEFDFELRHVAGRDNQVADALSRCFMIAEPDEPEPDDPEPDNPEPNEPEPDGPELEEPGREHLERLQLMCFPNSIMGWLDIAECR